jgi:dodecin
MPESTYDVIQLIGTSNESWEKAAANAVEQASKSLRDVRIAEIVELDMQLDAKGKVEAYRAKVKLSFKYGAKSSRVSLTEADRKAHARSPIKYSLPSRPCCH